jgi:hypothetical protein
MGTTMAKEQEQEQEKCQETKKKNQPWTFSRVNSFTRQVQKMTFSDSATRKLSNRKAGWNST